MTPIDDAVREIQEKADARRAEAEAMEQRVSDMAEALRMAKDEQNGSLIPELDGSWTVVGIAYGCMIRSRRISGEDFARSVLVHLEAIKTRRDKNAL
jgi:hypothetical protein